MSFARAIVRQWRRLRGQPDDEHQQQLMQLYWNRAELKKELSKLQDERHALLQKLEAQQAVTRVASEKIDELAAYLGRPEVGSQALLYFQLRALWYECSRMLAQFVVDLRKQQEDRERRRHTSDCEANRDAQVAEMDERLLNAQSIADSLQARLNLLNARLQSLRGFWNYWRRREVRDEIGPAHAQWDVAATNVTDLADEREALASAPLPDFPGLSLEGKRIINTAAIAYAEWLIANLPQRQLAWLARQAIGAQIYDVSLGSADECERWMSVVASALKLLPTLATRLATLREPTERVRARAVYRSAIDTVPLSESLGTIQLGVMAAASDSDDDSIAPKQNGINVLIDDYWSIAKVLIH